MDNTWVRDLHIYPKFVNLLSRVFAKMGPSHSQKVSQFFIQVPANPVLAFSPFENEKKLTLLQTQVIETLQCASYVAETQLYYKERTNYYCDCSDCDKETLYWTWDFGWPAGILKLLNSVVQRLASLQECEDSVEISQLEIKIYFLRVKYKNLTKSVSIKEDAAFAKTDMDNNWEKTIKESDKKSEAIAALVLCEQILTMFCSKELIFSDKPLLSCPLLLSFAGIYRGLSVIMIKLMPELESRLKEKMRLLRTTVISYKSRAIQERIDSVKILGSVSKAYSVRKLSYWDTELTTIAASHSHRAAIVDFYDKRYRGETKLKKRPVCRRADELKYLKQYNDALRTKYDAFFNPILDEFIAHTTT